jgi:hypothetical protein
MLESCQVSASGLRLYYFDLPSAIDKTNVGSTVAVFLQSIITRCAHQGTCSRLLVDDLRLSTFYLIIISKSQMALHR